MGLMVILGMKPCFLFFLCACRALRRVGKSGYRGTILPAEDEDVDCGAPILMTGAVTVVAVAAVSGVKSDVMSIISASGETVAGTACPLVCCVETTFTVSGSLAYMTETQQ